MAKGITISITLPEAVCNFYSSLSEELGTSRSKVITGVLMNDYLNKSKGGKDIDCKHLDGTYCKRYETECNADETCPETCPSYEKKE